jgi:hypothetical protein
MKGAEPLSGAWTHSFEEDEGDVQVYRSSNSFAFPAARRARETLEFPTPGQVVTGVPGPDDRLRRTNCSLTPMGMGRFRIGEARVIEVIQSTSDILKVRPS